MATTSRYLAIVKLHPKSDLMRVKQDAPDVLSILRSHSTGEFELAFRSSDGTIFGAFLNSKEALKKIVGAVNSSPCTAHGDSLMIVETGNAVDGFGFGRQITWLQRH